ncbi:MAG: helix-turn-helix domain-containing protein [Eubacteriales bacterium]
MFNQSRIGRGEVAYLRSMFPNDVEIEPGKEMEHYWFSFGGTKADELLEPTGLTKYPIAKINESAIDLLEPLLHEAVFGMGLNDRRLSEKFEGLLRYTLSFIGEKTPSKRRSEDGSVRAAEYAAAAADFIKQSLNRGVNTSDVAKYIGITEKYLCKIFHQYYGITPSAFINECRNDKSMRLLRTTALDVKSIASLCGFNDPSYFAKWFRHMNGCSASDYRASLHETDKDEQVQKGTLSEK